MSINQNKSLIVYLAALGAFGPFSTDIYLASMPTIQKQFHTSATHVQLTLSLFFAGFAIMQLVWGPLSDRKGRKLTVLIGVSMYAISSLACALSQSIGQLILARLIQSTGACAGTIMSIAIIKDRFNSQSELTKAISTINSVSILAPMIAPIFGSYLFHHFGWRANFIFLTLYGSALVTATCAFDESHLAERRKPLPINRLIQAYNNQVSQIPFFLTMIAVSTNFCILFSFISSSAFIYIDLYHVAARHFGYLFALNALGLSLGSLLLNRIKLYFSDSRIIFIALTLPYIGATLMAVLIYSFPHSIISIMIASFISTLGIGILYPMLMAQALQHVKNHTGIASSLLGTCRFILAAIIGVIMGLIIKDNAYPLPFVMLVLNSVTLLTMLIYFHVLKLTKQK